MIEMKKVYKRIVSGLFMMLVFANAHAVFEGRNTTPNDLPGIRNNVEVAPIENQYQKARNVGDGGEKEEIVDDLPLSDSPLLFLLLGGVTYGAYIFRKNRKLNRV